jgi:signal transduction histidine kinase
VLSLLGLAIALAAVFAYRMGVRDTPENRPVQHIVARIDDVIFSNRQVDLQSLTQAGEIVRVAQGLDRPDNPEVSLVLETARRIFSAELVYVQDRAGTVVSCTKYEGGKTLTGNSYAFRPYFISALHGDITFYPAMGVTTGMRGLYFSTPIILDGRRIVGVLVVKASLDGIDAILAADPTPVFLLSPDGVIFASNQKDMLFHYVKPMGSAELDRIKASQQFGGQELKPFPDLFDGKQTVTFKGERWTVSRRPILSNWTIVALARGGPAYMVNKGIVFALIGVLAGLVLVIAILASVIRAREKAEAALRESREHLEEMVERRTTELRAAKETAEAATEAKSIFLASISHELRTPLNAILGYAQLLTRSIRVPENRDNLQRIHRAGEHLLGLINHVLSLSKIESGNLTLDPQPFPTDPFFKSIEDMTRIRAMSKRLDFRLEVRKPFPEALVGDSLKLRQILVNLLGNAMKFTLQGTVTLTVERVGPMVRFSVQDTGAGMGPDELPKLFQAFQQTQSGREAAEGTGLGLHISQAMVQLMGGVIEVESELGRGSRFHFEIPMAEELLPAAEPAQPLLELAPGHPSLRMLVVDDVEDNRTLLARMLTTMGMEVREAADGPSALAQWEAWQPHVVWMDLRMPGMDGNEAVERLRAREAELGRARTVVIAMTASALDLKLDPLLELRFDDLVTKPFPERELVDKLHRHCGLELSRVAAPAPLEAEPRPEPDQDTVEQVLLVDDNPANLDLLEQVLRAQGYRIRCALSGPLALESARAMPPDLVILDISMPGMDGFEVCRQMKLDDHLLNIPIIFISALDHVLDKVNAFKVGGADYVTKPFQVEEIIARVDYQIQLRRLRQQLAQQVSGIRLYAEALRAQTHEFMNKLHVILGLIRMEQFDRLAGYITGLTGRLEDEVGQVVPRVKDPMIAGFLLARSSAAREQNVTMVLSEDSQVPLCASESVAHDLVTILGNLMENAVEAMGESTRREIRVDLQYDADRLEIAVADTGPGIPAENLERLFERGYSTKGEDRGFGLYHASLRVTALGGRLEAGPREGGGTVFRASIRYPEKLPD